MRLRLDTPALLWFAAGDAALSEAARDSMVDPSNGIWVSHASVLELAIKISLGKLRLDRDLPRWLERYVVGNGFSYLPISVDHAAGVARLPHHHGDPFDRLLVVQCATESFNLVSRNSAFDADGVKRRW
ncbi:MAG: type II toxin-antitoxin system VapC family toxin [Verrucomicrobia bacterium]|nr:type II toxin-antitoxin system VapC family toxin [Verrucomicrobiota bacterium]